MERLNSVLKFIGVQINLDRDSKKREEEITEEEPRPKRHSKPKLPPKPPLEYIECGAKLYPLFGHGKPKHYKLPIGRPRAHYMVGITGTGKTNTLEEHFYCYSLYVWPSGRRGYFSFGFAMSASAKSSGNLHYLPANEIHSPDAEKLIAHIEWLWELAEDLANEGRRMPPNYLILDDCTGIIMSHNQCSTTLKNFMTAFGHTNTWVWNLSHKNTANDPLFRENSQRVIQLENPALASLKSMYDSYGLYLPKEIAAYKDYKEWVAKNIRGHTALLYSSEKTKKEYYKYEATNMEGIDFKLYHQKRRTRKTDTTK
jgi:hypothetical protein